MAKFTISMAIFNSYVSHYQRVGFHYPNMGILGVFFAADGLPAEIQPSASIKRCDAIDSYVVYIFVRDTMIRMHS